MSSISPATFPSPSTRADQNQQKFCSAKAKFSSSQLKLFSLNFNSHSLSSHSVIRYPVFDSTRCRCSSNNNNSGSRGGGGSSDDDSLSSRPFESLIRNAIKKLDDYLSSYLNVTQSMSAGGTKKEGRNVVKEGKGNGDVVEDWDWERWRKHFADIDDQELILTTLKSQLDCAVNKEDYEDAARLKVAIAAAATNDTVGQVMSYLSKAVKEERYGDAALLRDYAGTGLVGWWAGISEDANDPYGCIIRISAEHGRYVARSYSPRQLATTMDGAPLFEIFFTVNKKGEYKQQAVYLKRRKDPQNFPIPSPKVSSATNNFGSLGPTENKGDLLEETTEDAGDSGDTDEDSSFENTLRDLIPGVKVKVLKVTTPGKMDRDIISKVVDQIIEDEDEEQDFDLESTDTEDDDKSESDEEQNDVVLDTDSEISDSEDQGQIALKVVVNSLSEFSGVPHHRDLLRVPARLEKKNHLTFTFTVEEDDDKRMSNIDRKAPANKKAKIQKQRSLDNVMLDLAKSVGKGRIPMKVLKDVGELISLTLNQARNRQPLSGSTTFNRIDIPGAQDPLNGLYIGAHGLYTSEVIQLRRRFGQWKEDSRAKEPPNVEFYEYVEATKLIGDPYVPAGQVAFRAKVGKRYQLPHKGIIPEEYGVIARYKGQGRLAEPGFHNPRWVDGELVILDGKYIKAGPVVGFVYWAPEYHFLVFFNRLKLQM